MKTGRLITLKMLSDARACSSQIEEFKKRFGDSVKVTKKLCLSVAQVFEWWFAAEHFLNEPLREEYNRQTTPLREEYNHQTAPLLAEYERQIAPLWEEYDRQVAEFDCKRASLWEEYKRQTAPLREEYRRQTVPLREEFNRQRAILFWKLYNADIT